MDIVIVMKKLGKTLHNTMIEYFKGQRLNHIGANDRRLEKRGLIMWCPERSTFNQYRLTDLGVAYVTEYPEKT